MVSRYDNRLIGINKTSQYREFLLDRNVNFIRQYFSPNLRHPTDSEVLDLDIIGHEWRVGDRYYKLANEFYGDSKMWWVIAWFNQKPTESHVELGELIEIPLPLDKILALLDV